MTINNFLRKEQAFLILTFLAILSVVGCQKQPNLNFGSTYISDDNSANIVRVDTSSISMSTIYTDSIPTRGSGYLLIGNVNDPYFGKVSSRTFFQVSVPASAPTIGPYDVFDSIGMILYVKKGNPFYGDSTIVQKYNVSQVDTLFELPAFYNGYFSNYSYPTTGTIGSTSALIYPNVPYTSQGTGDTLRIRMNDALGKQIFNMYYNNSDSIRAANFLYWFHGLCISPDPSSQGNITAFKDSCVMRIYYHTPAVTAAFKTIDFQLTNKQNQWNNITVDRSTVPLKNLIQPTPGQPIPPATPTSQTGGIGYVQGPTGLQVKLTFPYLNALAQRPDYLSVLRATLTVRLVPGSYNTIWQPAPQIGVYTVDQHNVELASVPSTTGTGQQTGNLVLDWQNPTNIDYTYDITAFIKAQILNTSVTANQSGIILTIPPGPNTYNLVRTAIADQSFPINRQTTMSIYYVSLYPHQ